MVSVKVTLAPKASMVKTRSLVELDGMANSISIPYKRAIMAKAIPVFPEVASINLVPALISPRSNAP